MTYLERTELEALSMRTFKIKTKYKQIMKRGRKVSSLHGASRVPITAQEIKDTMLFILAEREKEIDVIRKKVNEGRAEKSGRDNSGGQVEENKE